MRKKFYFIAVCAMVISGGAVCYKTIPSSSESNLFIENVEALSASGESDAGKKLTCYSSWTGEGGDLTVYKCSPCGSEVKCKSASDKDECN